MAEPPSYEEITAGASSSLEQKGDRKIPQSWSIREQVGLSRTQHVASVVSQIVDHIRERASQGLSKTTLVMIPSDQDASRKGTLVGFPDSDAPTMIQFEGRQNGMQFWQQDEALSELQAKLHLAVSDRVPMEEARRPTEQYASPPPPLQAPRKTSWFGRKAAPAPEPMQQVRPAMSPVTVNVQLDEMHFRSETEYGLYETLRARAVVVIVDIR